MSELFNEPDSTPPPRDQIEERFDAFVAGTPGILVDPSTIGRMVDQYQDGYVGQPFQMRQRQDVVTEQHLMIFSYLLGLIDRLAA